MGSEILVIFFGMIFLKTNFEKPKWQNEMPKIKTEYRKRNNFWTTPKNIYFFYVIFCSVFVVDFENVFGSWDTFD